MRGIWGLLFLLIIQVVEAQEALSPSLLWDGDAPKGIAVQRIPYGQLPRDVDYRGVPREIIRWTDSTGVNLLVICETQPFSISDSTGRSARVAEVQATLYSIPPKSKGLVRRWRVQDYGQCGDSTCFEAAFLPGSLSITDLDSDGRAEVSVMYHLICQNRQGPGLCKLFLAEGNDKYLLRGETAWCNTQGVGQNVPRYTPEPWQERVPWLSAYATRKWNAPRCQGLRLKTR